MMVHKRLRVLFNSFSFMLVFLPIVLLIALHMRGTSLLAFISIASFIFYALFGHPWFLIPMSITILLDFFLAIRLMSVDNMWARRGLLGLSLCGNLGLLIAFKYSGLLFSLGSETINFYRGISTPEMLVPLRHLVLPAGISFYTFQTLSYMIDVYRGETPAERNFWKFTAFVSFFPHLIAGPLTRHHQLLPGLENIRQHGIQPDWPGGIFLFCIGLSKKILLADPLGRHADSLIAWGSAVTFPASWIALLSFSLQIYFDFSGYCDMAIGLGRLFGIELPQNFNNPYSALNPTDFWRRWHITLSQWMRDYLYFSLGGSRGTMGRVAANLMITMLLGGLWHGARWTFLIWGFYHGVLLLSYHVLRFRWDSFPRLFQRAMTFVLVCMGWTLFRADSFVEAWLWLGGLFGLHGVQSLPASAVSAIPILLLGFAAIIWGPVASRTEELKTLRWPWQVLLAGCTLGSFLLINRTSHFLYFQF